MLKGSVLVSAMQGVGVYSFVGAGQPRLESAFGQLSACVVTRGEPALGDQLAPGVPRGSACRSAKAAGRGPPSISLTLSAPTSALCARCQSIV